MNSDATTRIAVALGSNLGDRRAHLAFAVRRLTETFSNVRASAIRETDPVGVPVPQPQFLNMAVVATTPLGATETLACLQAIEAERGRERPFANAPRTLDLDLILHGDTMVETPELAVPHTRFRERAFVLEPLAEIAPELRDPVTGATVAELLRRLER